MAFLSSVLIARWLGQDAFGEYAYAVAIVGVLAMVARCGFGTSLLRFHGEYRAQARPDLAAGATWAATLTTLVAAALLGLALWAWGRLGAESGRLTSTQLDAIRMACWLIPVYGVLGLAESVLLGLRRPGLGLMVDQLWRPLLLCTALGLLALAGRAPLSSGTAVAADALAGTIAALVAGVIIFLDLRHRVAGAPMAFALGAWLRLSLPLLLLSGFQVVLGSVDVLMLGALTGPADTGAYAAAARVARLVLFGLAAIGAVTAPLIAEHHHAGRREELRRLLRWAARALFAFTALAAAILLLAGRFVLGLFGPGFEQAYVPLAILLIGQAINSLTGPVAYLLTMTGNQTVALFIVAFSALLCAGLNAALIPIYGLNGAALATSLAVATSNLLMLAAVRKRLGLNPTLLGKP